MLPTGVLMAADTTSEAGINSADVRGVLVDADAETECTPVGPGNHARTSFKLGGTLGDQCVSSTGCGAATSIEAATPPFAPPSWQCFRACWGDDASVVGDLRLRLLFQVYCDLASTTHWRNVQVICRGLYTGEAIYAVEGYYTRKPKRARGAGDPAGIFTESGGLNKTAIGPHGLQAPLQEEVLALVYPLAHDDSLAACRFLELLSCLRPSSEGPANLILALCNEQEIVYEELRAGLFAATEEEDKLKKTRARIK